MKTVKQFLLAIAVVSFFFLTGCTTMQDIPYDGVYYSTAKGAPQNLNSQNTGTITPTHYKVVKIQAINTSNQDTASAKKQQMEGFSIDTLRTDTIRANKVDSVVYSNIKTGMGFDNPYFGTGIESWSLGGYAGLFGFNNYWYSPYWYNIYYPFSSFYYGYPYYGYGGWGMYGYGYPYGGLYGYGYPYWGFGSGYPYYGYYGFGSPYYYGINSYYYGRHYKYYGHRGGIFEGSRIPFGGVGGGGLLPNSKSTRATNVKPSGVRPSAISEKSTGVNAVRRPAGSMRYQKALNEAKARGLVNNEKMLQKPAVYRSTEQTRVATPQYKRPAPGQRMGMSVPRYQKPKQYQSLDTRQVRGSNEYFRPQPQTIYRGRVIKTNTVRRPAQKFNIYRPSLRNTPAYRYSRPVYNNRSTWIRTTKSAPVQRYSSPRFYSAPRYQNSNSQPARISTGGNSGGGGGHFRGGGGGHIR